MLRTPHWKASWNPELECPHTVPFLEFVRFAFRSGNVRSTDWDLFIYLFILMETIGIGGEHAYVFAWVDSG